ncbi:MAG TPA: sigma-70 family RNA polymerase sigma factor [Bacteroidales bacterium]|nr:sigma-70 family RNA polymerase sigma factor [Bacteroidales bacterium]HRX96693.1 sigma-70 family RNA polymerase sigma factor [Bacteroidales bacterium]
MIRGNESRNYGFNLLVRQYQERVYHLIRRMVIDHNDTDDLVQETFIKVWQNLESFRSDSKLFTWIYRIATNEALSFLNKKKRRFMLPLVDYDRVLESKLSDGHSFSGDEIQKKLFKALLTLPEKQRLVFQMKYFEELKYDEISEVLGTSVGALKASYHIAVKKIEENLKTD